MLSVGSAANEEEGLPELLLVSASQIALLELFKFKCNLFVTFRFFVLIL